MGPFVGLEFVEKRRIAMGLAADRGQLYFFSLGIGFRQFYQVAALERFDLGLLHGVMRINPPQYFRKWLDAGFPVCNGPGAAGEHTHENHIRDTI